jgi:hypothetical protein
VKQFNFRKTIMRNDFTTIFGGVGRRRGVRSYMPKFKKVPAVKKFNLQRIRRAHQGWMNLTFGRITALRIRRIYGRRKPIAQFRR